MTTIELKNILIHKIAEIEDVSFLKAIKTILDSKADKEILSLTNEQRNEIMQSKKEIEKGLFIEHDELDKEIKEWLGVR
jgi:predicted transcriptional regulator